MGNLRRRKANGNWYGEWKDFRTGKWQFRSLATKDKATATARLRQLELVSTDSATYSSETLMDAIGFMLATVERENAAMTWRFYRSKARHLVRVLGNVLLASISRGDMSRYVSVRSAEGASNNTIRKELITMRRALKDAKQRDTWRGDVGQIVVDLKNDYVPRKRWLDTSEVNALLKALPAHRAKWVALAVGAGLRKSELDGIKRGDMRRGNLYVRGTKTAGSVRIVPVSSWLEHWLHNGMPAPWPNAVRDLAVACRGLGIAKCSPNDLRRTFGSNLAQRGVMFSVIAKLMGNSVRMVENVYAQFLVDDFKMAVEAGCSTSDRNTAAFGATNDTERLRLVPRNPIDFIQLFVPRDGIEPPTRGFSVLGKSNVIKKVGSK